MAVGGDPELNAEYMYLHIQKRPMNFTPGLEKEDSFMVISNEFVKDHELIPEDIHTLMTPSPESGQSFYGAGGGAKPKFSLFSTVRNIIIKLVRLYTGDDRAKILKLKQHCNKLLHRKLPIRF